MQNTAAGGGDAQVEDVSLGKVRLKFTAEDTDGMQVGVLFGEVWIYDSDDDEPHRIGTFRLLVTD